VPTAPCSLVTLAPGKTRWRLRLEVAHEQREVSSDHELLCAADAALVELAGPASKGHLLDPPQQVPFPDLSNIVRPTAGRGHAGEV
jgi:hypothetical protein